MARQRRSGEESVGLAINATSSGRNATESFHASTVSVSFSGLLAAAVFATAVSAFFLVDYWLTIDQISHLSANMHESGRSVVRLRERISSSNKPWLLLQLQLHNNTTE